MGNAIILLSSTPSTECKYLHGQKKVYKYKSGCEAIETINASGMQGIVGLVIGGYYIMVLVLFNYWSLLISMLMSRIGNRE